MNFTEQGGRQAGTYFVASLSCPDYDLLVLSWYRSPIDFKLQVVSLIRVQRKVFDPNPQLALRVQHFEN